MSPTNGQSEAPILAADGLPVVPVESPPFLSLCVICGDEGVEGMERLLTSCLNRDSGPMFDEVSVYWNGSPEKKPECLKVSSWTTKHGFSVPILVKDGPWRNDFSWARQISYEQANGPWRAYLDSDDIIAPSNSIAVQDSLESASAFSTQDVGVGTLKQLLKELPPQVNAVWLPYNYVEIEGKVATRIPRCRVVRWADGWTWGNPVHEDLFPVRGNVAIGAMHAGLVVQHRPLRLPEERTKRNQAILEGMIASSNLGFVDHRTYHGIAAIHFDHRNDALAIEFLKKALACVPPPPPADIYLYRILLAQACTRSAQAQEALEHGAVAMLAQPTLPGGYLEVARAYYFLGDFGSAVIWFRKGFDQKEHPAGSLLQAPMAVHGQLRALAANALLTIGAFEEAHEWAKLAVAADPGLFPERTLILTTDRLERKQLSEVFRQLADYLLSRGEIQQVVPLLEACPAIILGDPAIRTLKERVLAALSARDADPEPLIGFELTDGVRVDLGLASSDQVVGSELTLVASPTAYLDKVEALSSGVPVTVAVPDGETIVLKAAGTAIRRSAYTRERLYNVLSGRGVVKSLSAVRVDDRLERMGEGWLLAKYVPGPRLTGRRIGIWCPHFAQLWGPKDPEHKGTGGSEEAVLYLSRALAKAGCDVEVFAPLPPGDAPLIVDGGVKWRELRTFDPSTPYDHLLMHRAPWGPRTITFGAKQLWTWHHDHFYAEDFWTPRVAKASKHFFVSRWQRRILEGLIKTPLSGKTIFNGVPVEQFQRAKERAEANKIPRSVHGVAFASMPTRGLDRLFDVWGDVRAAVPDATLFIYYGMQTARQLWRGPYSPIVELLTKLDQQMEKFIRDGWVVNRGRVGQDALTDEFLQLGVLAYPAGFPEVHMIAGARAGAAGMRLVTTDTGCLEETLPDKTYMVRGAISDEQWANGGREVYLAMLVKALTDPEEAYDREGVAKRTLDRYSWDHVAGRVLMAFEAAEANDEAMLTSDVELALEMAATHESGARVPKDEQLAQALADESVAIRFM